MDAITRDEAIKELSEMRTDYWTDNRQTEALDMAIKSLKQDLYEDAVSGQTVLDNLSELNVISFYEAQEDSKETYYEIRKMVESLPPVRPQALEILDTIDFAIDASNGDTDYFVGFRNGLRYAKSLVDGEEPQYESCSEEDIQAYIDATPSVRPQEPTSPCDLCVFNPPSSCDGKPCTMCPAERREDEF